MKDIEQLKKYLDDLVKLETEKYRLEEIKKTLVNFGIQKENEVNSPNINKEKLEIELNSKFDNLEKEIELQKEKINSSKLEFNRLIMSFCSFGLLFCIASAMYMLILGIIFGDDGISAAIVLALITTIILYIISKFKEKEKCDEEKNVLYDLEATLNEKKEKIKLEYDVLIEKSIDDYNVNKNKLIILCNNNSQNLVKLDELYKYIVRAGSEMQQKFTYKHVTFIDYLESTSEREEDPIIKSALRAWLSFSCNTLLFVAKMSKYKEEKQPMLSLLGGYF